MNKKYDTIVLGLGAMGSATTYQLAKKGNKVLGIEQFSSPHHFGSSHGETRIIRQAIGEGEEYVPLVLRSYEIFREMEKETGKKLLTVTGGLIISSQNATGFCHVENFFQNTLDAAQKFNVKHEILSAEEIRHRFPQFNVADNEQGYFEHEAGFLNPEECIQANIDLAKKYGAEIRDNEKVLKYEATSDHVTVTTNKGKYVANKLVISAGSWLPDMLPEKYKQHFKVTRQVVLWFDPKEKAESFLVGKFPIFIWQLQHSNRSFYGFPALDAKGGIKVGAEQSEITTKADIVDRNVTNQEVQHTYETFVKNGFPGVSGECVKKVVCLYNCTPDAGFVIDKHPHHNNVIIASPCSGHGFKHSAAIGETLTELVIENKTKLDISKFSFQRFVPKHTEMKLPRPSL